MTIPVSAMGVVDYPSGNMYAKFRDKYGVGAEDFGVRPYAQPYPHAIQPLPIEYSIRRYETPFQKLIRFLRG